MSDFEDRLTTALHSAGDDAPAGRLAGAARRRARSRRRTALTSAAAVVAVVGVVGGVALLGNGGDRDAIADGPIESPTASQASDPEPGWRNGWSRGAISR